MSEQQLMWAERIATQTIETSGSLFVMGLMILVLVNLLIVVVAGPFFDAIVIDRPLRQQVLVVVGALFTIAMFNTQLLNWVYLGQFGCDVWFMQWRLY